eukprot:CAMPEP_0113895666 /NCGR_PEP_ID=MMETSP0780_2-20120614/17507_1 /TAXON_ID=652834 /ORGANISM="Palpitomonas bilix" /LENGTH=1097 /DNA_ID=CAMNT_0000886557 /DNA_START=21 /DNA_END=3314 /DNA_ORIENTATION=- /assembly_acc=CAM_ASM_000599
MAEKKGASQEGDKFLHRILRRHMLSRALFGIASVVIVFLFISADRAALPDAAVGRVRDEKIWKCSPHCFDEGHARSFISELTGSADRTVSSAESDHFGVDLLLRTLTEMRHEIAAGGGEERGIQLDFEVQTGEGSFENEYRGFLTITNSYANITNIVARLTLAPPASDTAAKNEEADGSKNRRKSLLMSTHFDTMPNSPGASDAGSGVATIMESLRFAAMKASHPDKCKMNKDEAWGELHERGESCFPLRQDLVILFNGCEELGLQASHAFIEGHRWATDIMAVINADAGGVGGKSLLVQTGPRNSWVAHLYQRYAPFPHGSVIGQDLFQSTLVPSDTDFRVYSEFIPGLDMVYYLNGYIYHTEHDVLDQIDAGSLRHQGDNMIGVLPAFLSLRSFPNDPDETFTSPLDYGESAVYFHLPFNNMLSFNFSSFKTAAFSISAFSLFLVLIYIGSGHVGIGKSLKVVVVEVLLASFAFILAIVVPLVWGLLIDFVLERPMRWFSNNVFLAFVFLPLSFAAAIVPYLLPIADWIDGTSGGGPSSKGGASNEKDILNTPRSWSYLIGPTFFNCALSLLFVSGGVGTAYVPLTHAFTTALVIVFSLCLSPLIDGNAKSGKSGTAFALASFTLSLIPIAITIDCEIGLLGFFLPTMGRFGKIPSDAVMGALLGFFSCMIWMWLIATMRSTSKPSLSLPSSSKRSVLSTIVIVFLLFSTSMTAVNATALHPYDKLHPKRVFVQEIIRSKCHCYFGDSHVLVPTHARGGVDEGTPDVGGRQGWEINSCPCQTGMHPSVNTLPCRYDIIAMDNVDISTELDAASESWLKQSGFSHFAYPNYEDIPGFYPLALSIISTTLSSMWKSISAQEGEERSSFVVSHDSGWGVATRREEAIKGESGATWMWETEIKEMEAAARASDGSSNDDEIEWRTRTIGFTAQGKEGPFGSVQLCVPHHAIVVSTSLTDGVPKSKDMSPKPGHHDMEGLLLADCDGRGYIIRHLGSTVWHLNVTVAAPSSCTALVSANTAEEEHLYARVPTTLNTVEEMRRRKSEDAADITSPPPLVRIEHDVTSFTWMSDMLKTVGGKLPTSYAPMYFTATKTELVVY